MRRQLCLVAVASLVLASVAIASSSETSDVAREDAVAMQKVHMTLSASCFNDCWKIIDKPEKSAEDVENMILLAYASLWHWKERADCEPPREGAPGARQRAGSGGAVAPRG